MAALKMTAAEVCLAAVNNSCSCCLSSNNLKQMMLGVYTDGKLETYAQMFTYCFKIEFMTDISTEYDYLICQKCIDLLRLSYTFINQVVKAQASLQNRIVQTGGIKIEPDTKLDDIEVNTSKPIIVNIPLDNSLSIKEEKNIIFDDKNTQNLSSNVFNESDNKPDIPKIKLKVKNVKPKLEFTDDIESNFDLNKANENRYDLFECTMNYSDTNDDSKSSSQELIDNLILDIDIEAKNIKRKLKKRYVNRDKDNNKIKKKYCHPWNKLPYTLEKSDLTCKICNETFIYHTLLTRHMCIHFPNYVCDVCGKAFPTRGRLNNHLYTHDSTEHKCDICKKIFKGAQNLQTHIRHVHKNPMVYKCPHCPERFDHLSFNKRRKHLVEVHNDEPKKHKCQQCPQRFSRAGGLNSHIRNVHLVERNHSCSECTSTFFSKSDLVKHMLKHTGDKKFECDVCHKSYGRKFTLNEHMKIHNNIKKFVCQICDKAFTQKCSLKGHMKTHANVESKSELKVL